MKKILIAILVAIFPISSIILDIARYSPKKSAYYVDAATYETGTCDRATILSYITNTASPGDIVSIPAGSCTWTTTLSFTKAITLQGAGTNTIEATSITLTTTSDGPLISFNSGTSASYPLIIKGFTLKGGRSSQDGKWLVGAAGNNWRITDNIFQDWCVSSAIQVNEGTLPYTSFTGWGLIDKNYFTYTAGRLCSADYSKGATFFQTGGDSNKQGWPVCRDFPHSWGTSTATYVENNRMEFDTATTQWHTDGKWSPRVVLRFNDLKNGIIFYHGPDSVKGRVCSVMEVYNNDMSNDIGDKAYPYVFRSGALAYYRNSHKNYTAGGDWQYNRAKTRLWTDSWQMTAGWPRNDQTEWMLCRDADGVYVDTPCHPTISTFASTTGSACDTRGDLWKVSTGGSCLAGDSLCVNELEDTCSLKFCSNHRDYYCNPASDPCPAAGYGTCSTYIDGPDTHGQYAWPSRDAPGTGPGGMRLQPVFAFGNLMCSGVSCTPSAKPAFFSGNEYFIENTDFFNCTSTKEDCLSTIQTYLATKTTYSVADYSNYNEYTCPHPLNTEDTGKVCVKASYGTSGYAKALTSTVTTTVSIGRVSTTGSQKPVDRAYTASVIFGDVVSQSTVTNYSAGEYY